MSAPLKWSYKTGIEADWCKSTADQKTRLKAVNKIFSASIAENCVVTVDDKSEDKDGSTVNVRIDSGDWKGEYLLSLPKQNAEDSVDFHLCAYWKNDVFFLTTDATATSWDGGSRDIRNSRLSAHMLMYACRIVESDGTVNIYYVSTKLNANNTETRLVDVFPMLDRPLYYSSEASHSMSPPIMPAYPMLDRPLYSSSKASNMHHPIMPAYPIPSETGSTYFGNLPNHMPGVFYSPEGKLGQENNYSIELNGRSIRMYPTGSVFFLVDA